MIKLFLLYFLKALGVFWICRKLVKDKTLILAYHGFETVDETTFRDKLFMKKNTFIKRLDYLVKYCNVVPLENYSLQSNFNNNVIITIDDGWDSTRTIAAPCLQGRSLPYTVYLTTENVLDNEPIFHIALDYILTKNIGKLLKLELDGKMIINAIISSENNKKTIDEIIKYKAKGNDTELLLLISDILKYDFNKVIDLKALTLMDTQGVRELKEQGADIQLHTHTHKTPFNDFETYTYEIEENKKQIENIIHNTPEHHCYPSGEYNEQCFNYLKRLSVKTATTCKPGFCDEKTNPYELPRFLDGENISQITFEAEVSGVLELFRKLKAM